MKLLLVSANRERDPYPVFPIGLAYLAPSLTAAGHELSALDLCFANDPYTDISAALDQFQPEAVLISLRNLDNVTWPDSRSYYRSASEIVAACRNRAITIIGGSGFSLMPLQVLQAVGADFGIIGEGEQLLPELLRRLENKLETNDLSGVVRADSMQFLMPEPSMRIGTPDRQLFDLARYHRDGGMANVQTKRGCPFKCIYCTYPILEGRQVRLRQIRDIISEIRDLHETCGVTYIYFVDDIFNYPVSFAEELCRSMAAENLPVKWSAFISPGFVTPRLLDLMLASGCDAIEFGSESGSDIVLRGLGKSFTAACLRQASQLCHDRGMDFAHYILFGGPGENRNTMLESFRLMDEINPTAVIGMIGIRIYPGTALETIAINDGIITADTPLLDPVFYISPPIKNEISQIVTEEAMKRRNWVVPGLEINTSHAMLEALRMFQVQGPLWKLMKRLGRSRIKPLAD